VGRRSGEAAVGRSRSKGGGRAVEGSSSPEMRRPEGYPPGLQSVANGAPRGDLTHRRQYHGYGRQVNGRSSGVLVVGLEPTRACAQRCVRSPRLPVSPHQHHSGCEPRQSRRPRRETTHVLPPTAATCERRRTIVVPRTREAVRSTRVTLSSRQESLSRRTSRRSRKAPILRLRSARI
jgi:hypothetical protein